MTRHPIVVVPADAPPLISRSQHLKTLREIADVRLYTDRPVSDSEMLSRLQPAEILLNSRSAVKISGRILSQLPNLKMIAVCGIGYDAIDLPAATEHGIVVSNIPGRTATVVAEHAFGLMLAVSRRMADMTAQLRNGQWSAELGLSLIGRRIGIIGTGNIGSEMLRLCRGFGMETVAWTLHPDSARAAAGGFTYVSLDELLQTSDVVSLHVRLSEQTRGLINAARLQQMKPRAILINTARAAVVDTTALAAALNRGHLFGAGVDVYDQEPVSGDHPLQNCPNVVLTPHSADQTPEGLDILTLGCIDNIQAFLNGQPQNVVSG
ncbi:MAG: NAD(P)-dependent oxidoreductase [Fuerstiella sp.]